MIKSHNYSFRLTLSINLQVYFLNSETFKSEWVAIKHYFEIIKDNKIQGKCFYYIKENTSTY